jgi:hypothetical protein
MGYLQMNFVYGTGVVNGDVCVVRCGHITVLFITVNHSATRAGRLSFFLFIAMQFVRRLPASRAV